jgi:hypothetical protein
MSQSGSQNSLSTGLLRETARDAYIYAYPLVLSYITTLIGTQRMYTPRQEILAGRYVFPPFVRSDR